MNTKIMILLISIFCITLNTSYAKNTYNPYDLDFNINTETRLKVPRNLIAAANYWKTELYVDFGIQFENNPTAANVYEFYVNTVYKSYQNLNTFAVPLKPTLDKIFSSFFIKHCKPVSTEYFSSITSFLSNQNYKYRNFAIINSNIDTNTVQPEIQNTMSLLYQLCTESY